MPQPTHGTSTRGFASMDETRQREIARKGGESVPAEKRSFSQNRALAAEAGRKGGTSRGTRAGDEKPDTNDLTPSQTGRNHRAKSNPAQAAEENSDEFDQVDEVEEESDAEENDAENSSSYRN